MMVSVLYGLLTWIPLYLVKEKGFTFMSMGLVASMPCIGGFIGAILAVTYPTNCSDVGVNRP